MDVEPIRKYFEENIKKGYTIEQISTNLKNNKYTDDVIQEAIKLLDPQHHEISQQNPNTFDYSKLPDNVKEHIEPKPVPQENNQQPPQKQEQPKIETHPGLDQKSLMMYSGIIGGILLIIIIGLFAFSGAEEEDFINEDAFSRNTELSDEEQAFRDGFAGSEEAQEEEEAEPSPINNTIDTNTIEDNTTNTTENTTEEIEYQDIAGQYCQQDSDCDDGNIQTKNWCGSDNTCRTGLGDPDSCDSNDGFCPESCYGKNDSDCVDQLGRMLCTESEHCDDDNNLTEDLCDDKKGYCIYFDKEPDNNIPSFLSEPTLEAIVGEEYVYEIEVEDDDEDDNITLTLESAPSSMKINDSILRWTPEEDEFWEEFTIIASDGKDEAEQEIRIMIYMDEEDDSYRDSCGTDMGCYLNAIIFSEEAFRCKYLGKYWEDPEFEEVDDCIFTIAQNTADTSVCQYITDATTQSSCENI
jgi:hypothetical protein